MKIEKKFQHYLIFISIFKKISKQLSKKRQRHFWILLIGMVIVAGLETLTAGGVALFMATIAKPEHVLHSTYLHRLQESLNLDFLSNISGLITIISGIVVGIMTCYVITLFLVELYASRYAGYVASFLGERLLTGFLAVDYEWILSKNSADLIQSITWRAQIFYFIRGILKILSDSLIAAILLMTLFYFEPLISIPVVLTLGLSSYFLFTRTRKYLDIVSNKIKNIQLSVNRHVNKALHGIKDIKVYGRHHLFTRDYHKEAYLETRLFAIQQVVSQSSQWIMQLIGLSLLAITVCLMFFFMRTSSAKAMGAIALLAVTAWRILPAVSRIIQNFNLARVNLPYLIEIFDYLRDVDYIKQQQSSKIAPDKHSGLKYQHEFIFNKVSFCYKGSEINVLNELSFKISRGQTVGIIGVSGAGKSTLVDLIIGLLCPASGTISIDGKILDERIKSDWMRLIGYVPQSPYICVGTVAENVAFGFTGDEIDRERVKTCCDMAAMDDFLWQLPDGIDTQIGERGVKLSGGQRQRVAIARALYHTPEVMIFDEATSSLDTNSEKAIQKTIYNLKGKHTLIIIAHRLSTVENSDQVIWLEHGMIKKIGTPGQILAEYRKSMSQEKVKAVI